VNVDNKVEAGDEVQRVERMMVHRGSLWWRMDVG